MPKSVGTRTLIIFSYLLFVLAVRVSLSALLFLLIFTGRVEQITYFLPPVVVQETGVHKAAALLIVQRVPQHLPAHGDNCSAASDNAKKHSKYCNSVQQHWLEAYTLQAAPRIPYACMD